MKNQFPRLILLALVMALAACESGTKTIVVQSSHATAANEIAAIARLRAIAMAEMHYQIESGAKYGSLDELIKKGLVNDPSQGKLTGYEFDLRLSGNGFKATATPEKFGVTGRRSFYIDERNVLRGADKGGALATASDPEV
jgi:hypothetical protein